MTNQYGINIFEDDDECHGKNDIWPIDILKLDDKYFLFVKVRTEEYGWSFWVYCLGMYKNCSM